MKKTLFFDFFGVISSEIAPFWFKRYFNDEQAAIMKDKICKKVDNGDISEMDGFEALSKIANISALSIREEWLNMANINKELVNKIIELKNDHKVYLLSNASRSFIDVILNKYDLHKLYDKEYVSSDMHLIKPNTNYFQYVINDLKLDPQNCIMVDDNIKNVNGAISAGINGIQFINNKKLFSELGKLL